MIIKLGDFAIRIKTQSNYLLDRYAAYRLPDDSPYLFEVEATAEAIALLKAQASETFIDDEYESTAILGEIADQLCHFSTILFHAATVAVDGEVYAFSATSGTGKSTHVRLWLEHFGKRALVVNGDKPFLTRKEDQIWVSGSPWCGKENWETNVSLPLKAVCFIERGQTNNIRSLDISEVIPRFFKQVRLPNDPKALEKVLDFLDWMFANIPFYELHCTISDQAVEVAYAGMNPNSTPNN